MGARGITAGLPAGPNHIPPSGVLTGGIEDAKFLELSWTLAIGETKYFDVAGMAFYVDSGPAAPALVSFSLDDCFPDMSLRYGLFVKIRPFRRIKLVNLSGVVQPIHLIYSENPNFLVMQFQVQNVGGIGIAGPLVSDTLTGRSACDGQLWRPVFPAGPDPAAGVTRSIEGGPWRMLWFAFWIPPSIGTIDSFNAGILTPRPPLRKPNLELIFDDGAAIYPNDGYVVITAPFRKLALISRRVHGGAAIIRPQIFLSQRTDAFVFHRRGF